MLLSRVLVAFGIVLALVAADKKEDKKAEDQAAAELKMLEGNWDLTKNDFKGAPPSVGVGLKQGLLIEGNKMTWLLNGKDTVNREGEITLDVTKNPKTLDIEYTKGQFNGKKQLCIYRLTKDKLEICMGDFDGKKRPTKFTSKPSIGAGLFYQVYKKQKD